MDRISKSLLEQFVAENSFETLEEDVAFEHFTSYLCVSKHYSESFDTDDIVVGGGGDTSIDGIAIIVNNIMVSEISDLTEMISESDCLDVSIIFIQSERSSSFDGSKIGDFGYGVKDFFCESPKLPRNDNVTNKSLIIDEIYKNSKKFRKSKPCCHLYYLTTGRWIEDRNLVSRRDSVIQDLTNLNLFSFVNFSCLGADDIQKIFQSSRNAVSAEINFTNRTTLPDISGIEQSYIGYLSVPEFLKIIEDENGDIQDTLFYDNVRHWQEWNPVNSKIRNTLNDSKQNILFPLMNNGVTIVARKIILSGNKFHLDDYQVVNGCQTSYVIHETKSALNESILVPVRIIATSDQEIKNLIIDSTNRQTPVSDEQLFAVTEFPRKLELFFESFKDDKKIYYERRARQYNSEDSIEKIRVIAPTNLIRAFVSMFNIIPHRATRNYKALLQNVGKDFFNPEHRLEMYYVAGFAHYRLEYFFRRNIIPKDMKIARHPLLLVYRIMAGGYKLPRFNSHEMARYCEKINKNLWNIDECKETFQDSDGIIREIAGKKIHGDNIRIEAFTQSIVDYFKKI